MLTPEVAAIRWGYQYFCDAVLSPADDGGIVCTASVIGVPIVRQILDESTRIASRQGEPLAESVAKWLFHRMSEVFMHLCTDAGSAGLQDRLANGSSAGIVLASSTSDRKQANPGHLKKI